MVASDEGLAARLTREHETVCVKGDTAVREPFGLGVGAHEEKYVSYRSRFLRAVTTFSPGHAIEMTSSIGMKARELGMGCSVMFCVAAMRSIR